MESSLLYLMQDDKLKFLNTEFIMVAVVLEIAGLF
jgi:hypothetical protein